MVLSVNANAGNKYAVLGALVSPTTYAEVVTAVIGAAEARRPLSVTAAAVHAVMVAVLDRRFRSRLNRLDIVTPDGQPVRWALRLLYNVRLPDRVYGPELTLRLCAEAEQRGLHVYFYGSSAETLRALTANVRARFPKLIIAGTQPSAFRRLTEEEQREIYRQIRISGADLVFVGLGCPRQENWVYEARRSLYLPLVAVGAAFDLLGGVKAQAPAWMQARGLEWLFRLTQEPRRLWQRYLLLNPLYIILLLAQWLRLRTFDTQGDGIEQDHRYG